MEYLAGASLGPWTTSILRDVGMTGVKGLIFVPMLL